MSRFGTNEEQMQLWYMLQNPVFTQRQMGRGIGLAQGAKTSAFVRWLEGFGYVDKTIDSSGRLAYKVASRPGLLDFYRRHRKMLNEKIGTYKVGRDRESASRHLAESGAVFCLTSAQKFYDDYARDPEIHVYARDGKLVDELEKNQGSVTVNAYWYKYSDDTVDRYGYEATSMIRTIMDLECSGMGYLAERIKRRIWPLGV